MLMPAVMSLDHCIADWFDHVHHSYSCCYCHYGWNLIWYRYEAHFATEMVQFADGLNKIFLLKFVQLSERKRQKYCMTCIFYRISIHRHSTHTLTSITIWCPIVSPIRMTRSSSTKKINSNFLFYQIHFNWKTVELIFMEEKYVVI